MKGLPPHRRRAREAMTDRLMERKPEREDADLIAIDPGDVYTGVAFFKEDDDGWYCMDAVEFGYWEFIDGFASTIMDRPGTPPTVVCESWRLFGDHSREKTGNEFLTSQLIGMIKYIVRANNQHFDKHTEAAIDGKMLTCELQGGMCEDPAKGPVMVELVMQRPDIKKPTAGILRHKKMVSVAKPIARELYHSRDHIVDAELHGWHHVLNTLDGKVASQDT